MLFSLEFGILYVNIRYFSFFDVFMVFYGISIVGQISMDEGGIFIIVQLRIVDRVNLGKFS